MLSARGGAYIRGALRIFENKPLPSLGHVGGGAYFWEDTVSLIIVSNEIKNFNGRCSVSDTDTVFL